MNERFRAVARWAALILIGVGAGGLALWVGVGSFAVLGGAVITFVCCVFVGASIWATYLRTDHQGDLAGPGVFRAVSLGFFAAGVIVGALSVGAIAAIAVAAAAGLIVLLLTRETDRSAS